MSSQVVTYAVDAETAVSFEIDWLVARAASEGNVEVTLSWERRADPE